MEEEAVCLVPVNHNNAGLYISTGTQSYHEHYTYLWKNADPTPYIRKCFTSHAVSAELRDSDNAHYIIFYGKKAAGVLKLTMSGPLADLPGESAMLLDKIYLLREFAGKGIGGKALGQIETLGRSIGKSVLWLYAMQQGPALSFYLKNGFIIREEKRLEYPEVRDEHRMMYLLTKPLQEITGQVLS